MGLTCPITGFDEFLIYRAIGEDEIEVILGGNVSTLLRLMTARTPEQRAESLQVQSEFSNYIFADQVPFRLWIKQIGVPRGFIERLVDLVWNWRLLKYDLGSHHLSIPEVQRHPLEGVTGPEHIPIRVPRAAASDETPSGGRDIFDPLQDTRNRDFWSPT